MEYILIGIGVLVFLVGLITFIYNKLKKHHSIEEPIIPDAECCGAHEICEKGLKKADPGILYFDDEELDQYAGRAADQYIDNEIDIFRDILYTLKKEDIEGLVNKPRKRNIELPNILRPEAWNML